MSDPRVEAYARLLVEGCLDVQPGWQVLVSSSVLARPLVEEVQRCIARRGAYAITKLAFDQTDAPTWGELAWAQEAPAELLSELPPLFRSLLERIDALASIVCPENTRAGTALAPELHALLRRSVAPIMPRIMSDEVRWVSCQFPCPALAQDAGMSVRELEDFLYGACLLDWEAEERRMARIAERFDRADLVRIVGDETDISFSLAGRRGKVGGLGANMPGGEVFYSPIEDSAGGVVTYSEYPACLGGFVVDGVRLVFRGGRVVEASAATNEEFLIRTLDTDPGARVLGEFGIGCNPGITRHMRNTLFDEKIAGTVHLAVGAGFPFVGGTNESVVHWDMVKDLRGGGELRCDGELVQRDGEWLL